MKKRHLLPIKILSLLLILLGIILFIGGIDLLLAGGSWYYAIAGILLVPSGALLWRNRMSGAYLYGLYFIATFIWTIVEAGDRIWAWIPRMALPAVLALWLVLCLPSIGRGAKRWAVQLMSGGLVVCFAIAIICVCGPQFSYTSDSPAPDSPLANAHKTDSDQQNSDWTHYGRDANATRYSPANQITPQNVSQLSVAWTYRTGDMPPADKDNKWAAENTPSKIGNGLYVCSATDNVMRLDPATGKEQWHWKSGVKYESVPYTAACRGVTHVTSKAVPEGQMCHTRLLVATLDARLVELDTETGTPCKQFGDNGQVSVMKGIGHSVPGWVAMNNAMPVVNGVIVTNHEVLDGQSRWAPSGVIRGWDVETGQFRWAWDVNRPDDHGEPPAGKTYSRGTPNSWTTMTADDALGLVYVPTGNSAADYYSGMRSDNENRVNSSIVALDARSGEERWVFQTAHLDVWDYDMGAQPTLMDYPGPDGAMVPAILVPTKRGQNFVLDRRTGKPLSRVEEKSVPTSDDVPGQKLSDSQPYSVDMPRFSLWDKLTESHMWGLTPIDQMMCRIMYRHSNYQGEFTPPSMGRPWLQYPSYNGGTDWGSVAYDPNTGIMVGNWSNLVFRNQVVTRKQSDEEKVFSIDDPRHVDGAGGAEGAGPQAHTPYGVHVSAFYAPFTKMLCNEPPYGMISAVDMHTKKVIWQHSLGSAEHNGPFGLPTHLPFNIGVPNNGGPIITAGGLIFVSATTDHKIRAFDIKTGKEVWSHTLPTGGQATPMTYTVDGEQYVVITATGHHFMETPPGDYVIAFKLPRSQDAH